MEHLNKTQIFDKFDDILTNKLVCLSTNDDGGKVIFLNFIEGDEPNKDSKWHDCNIYALNIENKCFIKLNTKTYYYKFDGKLFTISNTKNDTKPNNLRLYSRGHPGINYINEQFHFTNKCSENFKLLNIKESETSFLYLLNKSNFNSNLDNIEKERIFVKKVVEEEE